MIMMPQKFIDVETSVNSVIQDNLSVSKCTIDQLMAVLQLAPVNATITIRVQEFKPEEK